MPVPITIWEEPDPSGVAVSARAAYLAAADVGTVLYAMTSTNSTGRFTLTTSSSAVAWWPITSTSAARITISASSSDLNFVDLMESERSGLRGQAWGISPTSSASDGYFVKSASTQLGIMLGDSTSFRMLLIGGSRTTLYLIPSGSS